MLAEIGATTTAPHLRIDVSVPADTTVTGNPDDLSRIRDDGPGILAEECGGVFDHFVRLDASRGRTSGSTGLGLAIAREIATARGATIVLTEAETGGRAPSLFSRHVEQATDPRGSGQAAPRARGQEPRNRRLPETDR